MRRVLALVLVLAAAAGCGDDGGAPADGGPTAGLLVGQQQVDGALADTLEVVDPERPGDQTIDVADLARGIPAGPGSALYESGATIVLVDAEAGEVDDLGVSIGEVDLAYSRSSVGGGGGGGRYVVLLAPTGDGGVLVDVEEAVTTDLLGVIGEATLILGAEVAGDESAVLLNTDDGVFLVPTDDPEAAERVGDGAGQLLDEGSVLLTSADGAIVRDADGHDTVVSDEPGGALAVGDRVLVARGDEAVLLEPGSDEVLASAPFSTEGAAPVPVGETVLLPGGEAPAWTLVDGAEGTATELPELDGLSPAFNGRPARWVPFADEEARRLLAVDTEDGSIETVLDLAEGEQFVGLPAVADAGSWALVSTDDADGTHALAVDLDTGATQELGDAIQGATFSPDGEQVAWSSGEEAELRVGPVDDIGAAEVLTDGVALPIWLRGD